MNTKDKPTIEKLAKKYGDTELHFVSYYKYSFWYEGTTKDGQKIAVTNFGDASDIYRSDLTATETLKSLVAKLPVNYIAVGDMVIEEDS